MLINDDTAIVPGHGRPSNKAALQTYVEMLEDIKGKVQQAISQGKTLDEVVKMNSLTASYDAEHGGGFISQERIRETFYKSLSAPAKD